MDWREYKQNEEEVRRGVSGLAKPEPRPPSSPPSSPLSEEALSRAMDEYVFVHRLVVTPAETREDDAKERTYKDWGIKLQPNGKGGLRVSVTKHGDEVLTFALGTPYSEVQFCHLLTLEQLTELTRIKGGRVRAVVYPDLHAIKFMMMGGET